MKVREGYALRSVLDEKIVLPEGEKMVDFSGAIVLSDSAAFIWEHLRQDVGREELLDLVTAEFDVEREKAGHDLDALLERLDEYGVLEKGYAASLPMGREQ